MQATNVVDVDHKLVDTSGNDVKPWVSLDYGRCVASYDVMLHSSAPSKVPLVNMHVFGGTAAGATDQPCVLYHAPVLLVREKAIRVSCDLASDNGAKWVTVVWYAANANVDISVSQIRVLGHPL